MDSKQAECRIPFLRSCRKETTPSVSGRVTGKIPEWLQGTLIRVGPGLFYVGPDHYNHLFDGLALMHKFSVQNGQVTYQNRFLCSDTYKKNMNANRIVVGEFGTRAAAPDPCKTIFQRFASLFSSEELTDNDLVNIVRYTDEFYAHTETNFIWKVDLETLESLQKVDLSKYVSVGTATAHAHVDNDGTVYNVGLTPGSYAIIKFPPKENAQSGAFDGGSIAAKIPMSRKLAFSYFHSFGMTENYFVFVEQALSLSVPKVLTQKFFPSAYAENMQWRPEFGNRFHVVRRKDGVVLTTNYTSKAFALFHHTNAYEENDHLVVDMVCYNDNKIIHDLYLKSLQKFSDDSIQKSKPMFDSQARRYILPLNVTEKEVGKNLVQLEGSKATAVLQEDGSVFCEPEYQLDKDWLIEFPQINYEKFNCRKYQYFYAMANYKSNEESHLVKVDVKSGKILNWIEKGAVPSEPIFVASPGATEEDDGVLLASLLSESDDRKIVFIVLDAKTMKELGRTEFRAESSVPGTFHGIFVPKAS